MTQNNDYRGKARAVFLAALMVFSVLAVPAAFTGSAAAVENVSVDKVTHYENSSNVLLELTFSEEVNVTSGAQFEVRNSDDGNLATLDQSDVLSGVNDSTQVKLNAGSVLYRADNVLITGLEKPDGSTAIDDESYDITVADPSFDLSSTNSNEETVYQGATIAIYNGTSAFDSLEIEEEDGDYFVERGSGENSSVYSFNTSGRDLGTYNLTDLNVTGATQQINIRDLGLELSPDSFDIAESENFEGTISARPSNRQVDVDVLDSAGDSVASDQLNTGGNGEVDYDLPSQDAGEYTVEITDVATGVTLESDTINVTDQGGLTAEFEDDNIDVTQGDIAEITVNFNNGASEGNVIIGNIDESGYQYNVSITDTGDNDQATLYFNTYAADKAGANNVVFLSQDSQDDGVSLGTTTQHGEVDLGGDILATGSYEIAASAGASTFAKTIDSSDDLATLFVSERGESSINLWTASESTASDISDLEDLTAAVEDGTITETDTVTEDDRLVLEVQADGLSGLIANNSSYDHDADDNVVTEAFVDHINPDDAVNNYPDTNTSTNFSFAIEQTDEASNRAPKELIINQTTKEAMTVLFDKESNTYYAMLDVDKADFTRDTSDEDEFEASLNVKDARLLGADTSDYSTATGYENNEWESTSQEFQYLTPDGEFNLNEVDGDDYVTVENAEDQEVSGTINVAPGTEITVRLRGSEGSSFVKSQNDVVVNSDGTFSATFDFSDREVDDEFTASLRSGDELTNEDGLVVEQVVDEPEDETAPEDETEDDMSEDGNTTDDVSDDGASDDSASDDSATDGGSSEDDTTDESTPGFGAIVALVAVLGAALLASRRQN